ncbi:ABC transporter ATP-binding protein [Vibrio gazogenes]|uniref:ABC-type dipeptide transporter n=1 Tax=Vibrio gazogenes DSM 21264 = NBRC 103151 TaxID=1123492 RepID=A0A1M4UV82_VIBGA|nr:ABC transporter ATP-binding protein [Vibrio gazogenes]USP15671.1 ABC transporter ATP-binding protein [Vibrio gazogenes]SHE60510.1 peptide/nickel transport system ATP-binding protein [Vibrio gazogenes DSM 21264] [Vibrio gazogenes DSM 21264 = NBRC 103151]SJN56128.1 Oligopeptide transport ATP-binding protein OppD [Vibrio gazogenes]
MNAIDNTVTVPTEPLLKVEGLTVDFQTDKGIARAINGISFEVMPGESVAIVGESGCGKSVSSLAVMGLIPSPPGKIVSGSIRFQGQELVGMNEKAYRQLRGNDISMIFQEPMTALNPVLRIETQMVDVIRNHQRISRKQAAIRATEMLRMVGIPSPEKRIREYPHQLSGGMRQRVMIAMALSCRPALLLADEPTTALDVTIQAQVMYEIKQLKQSLNMAMVLVTHDLGVVAESCQRVVVMYCGEVVEQGPVEAIFSHPKHPYTQGLLQSIPVVRQQKIARLPTIEGMVPDLFHLPTGCRFADRCDRVTQTCRQNTPILTGPPEHQAACFHIAEASR